MLQAVLSYCAWLVASYGLIVVFGSLAGLALWATWHESDLRLMASALCLSFLVSNAVWFLDPPTSRPGIYTMCEMLIALAAYMAWHEHHYRALVLLGMISALSIASNVALALHVEPQWIQIHVHEVITNIFYALECLLATGMGIAHGVRTGRFDWRLGLRHSAGEPHGSRTERP